MKTISSKRIFNRIATTFKPQNESWIVEARMHIADAINAIGTTIPLESVKEVYKVQHHRCPIPCNAKLITGIEYKGTMLPRGLKQGAQVTKNREEKKEETGIVDYYDSKKLTELSNRYESLYNIYEVKLAQSLAEPNNTALANEVTELKDSLDRILLDMGTLTPTVNVPKIPDGEYHYYDLNPGYIVTSFSTGEITVHYESLVKDKDGYVMIPDIFEFQQACIWFTISNMILGGYSNPNIRYVDADFKANQFIRTARNAMQVKSPDEKDRFMMAWLDWDIPNNIREQFVID